MMMFSFHIALATSLLALAAGFFMLVWAEDKKGCCAGWGKLLGYIIMILSIISVICTLISGVKMWREGSIDRHIMDMIHKVEQPKSQS